jgi:hypothetical protein
MRPTTIEALRYPVLQRGFGGCLPQVERGACRHVVPTKDDTRLVTTYARNLNTLIGFPPMDKLVARAISQDRRPS